jgi:hypothetical protein
MNFVAPPVAATALLCLLMFAIVWSGVIAAIAYFGGWHELAKTFREEHTTFRIAEAKGGRRFRCASLSMGPKYFPTNYGNCLSIGVSGDGIDLQVWPMFRVLHPPLHIPWQAIVRCERETYFRAFCRTVAYLKNQRHPIRFYGAAGKEIFTAWSLKAATTSNAS